MLYAKREEYVNNTNLNYTLPKRIDYGNNSEFWANSIILEGKIPR